MLCLRKKRMIMGFLSSSSHANLNFCKQKMTKLASWQSRTFCVAVGKKLCQTNANFQEEKNKNRCFNYLPHLRVLTVQERLQSSLAKDQENLNNVSDEGLFIPSELEGLDGSNVIESVIYPMDFSLVNIVYESIVGLHNLTGLPWWATFLSAAFITRMALSPFLYMNCVNGAKLNKVQIDRIIFTQRLIFFLKNHNLAKGMTEKKGENLIKKASNEMYKQALREENCSPLRTPVSLVVFQLPLVFSTSFAIREILNFRMSPTFGFKTGIFPEISTDGFLWFQTLSVPDPYFIMPVLLMLSNLFIIEKSLVKIMQHNPKSKLRYVYYLFRCLTLGVTPFIMQCPSGLQIYWFSVSFIANIQSLALENKTILKALRVPHLEYMKNTSLKNTLKTMKLYYTNKLPSPNVNFTQSEDSLKTDMDATQEQKKMKDILENLNQKDLDQFYKDLYQNDRQTVKRKKE